MILNDEGAKNKFGNFKMRENIKLKSSIISHYEKSFTIIKLTEAQHPDANEIAKLKKTFKKTFHFDDSEISEKEVDFTQIEEALKRVIESKYKCLILFVFLDGCRDISRNLLTKCISTNDSTKKLRLIFILGSSEDNVVYEEMLNTESNFKSDFVLFYSKNIPATIETLCNKTFNSTRSSFMTMLKIASKELRKIAENPFIISTLTESLFCTDSYHFEIYPYEKYSISTAKDGNFHKIGKCVILNFKKFSNLDFPDREGTQQDVRSLVATFGELNFDCSVYQDLNSNKVVQNLTTELQGISEKNNDCFAICLLSYGYYGKVLCHNGVFIEFEKLVELVAHNKSLSGKPKLFFVQTSQKLLPGAKFCKNYPDLFIFYSSYIGQKSYRNTEDGTWFVQALTRAIQQYSAEHDLEAIAAVVSDSVVEASRNFNKSSSEQLCQNPCLYSTLTRPLIFEFDEDKLRAQPERGRCLILCYEGSSFFKTFDLVASFVVENFYCKTIRNLDYFETYRILQKESKNDISNCNSFYLCIYANECDEQAFETSTTHFNFKNWFRQIKKGKDKKILFNISINSISRKDNYCHCHQEGSLSFFYNSFVLNWRKDSEKHHDMMQKCFKTLEYKQNENNLKFLELQFSCISNPNEKRIEDKKEVNFTENVYAGTESKAGHCVIIACAPKDLKSPELNRLSVQLQNNISDTFKTLNFEVELQIIHNRSEIEHILDKKSKNQNSYNCFVMFVLAECSNNEIIIGNNEKLGIKNLLKYFDDSTALEGKPKLFFIQNLMTNLKNVEYNYEISKDCLITIVENNLYFLNSFCKLAKDHCTEYDILSIIHMARLMTTIQDSAKQFLFEFKSRLTKQFFLNKPQWLANQDYIKSNRLFYRDGRGKCVIYNNISDYAKQASAVKETFRKLNYSVYKISDVEVDHFKYDMLENEESFEYFFMFLFVEQKTNAIIVEKLIKHLSGMENWWGKPKVIFLLGSYKLIGKCDFATDSVYEEIPVNGYRIATYADFLLYQSKYVRHTVKSLCTFIVDPSTRYDLVTILAMISHEKMEKNNREIPHGFKVKKFRLTLSSSAPEIPASLAVSNTNSTLTRLISLKSPIDFTLNQEITNVLPEKVRGICLIFNHFKFKKVKESGIEYADDMTRFGTKYDADRLQKTFKNLKFEVTKEDDFTKQEIIEKIKNIDGTNINCLVICFLSHGNKDQIRCLDKYISVDRLIRLMANNHKLIGKPKFLIIQACRGKNCDLGYETKVVADGVTMVNSPESPQSIYSDMFLFWSTFEGYIAMRHEEYGSPFIQTFCRELKNNCNKYDIATIASIVSRKVSQQTPSCNGKKTKQLPTFYSTLNQPVLFSKVKSTVLK